MSNPLLDGGNKKNDLMTVPLTVECPFISKFSREHNCDLWSAGLFALVIPIKILFFDVHDRKNLVGAIFFSDDIGFLKLFEVFRV